MCQTPPAQEAQRDAKRPGRRGEARECMARVPIEEGFFRIPEDPAEPPRLLGSRCPACGEAFFPRRLVCAKCLHEGTEDIELSTKGTIYTWTYCHVPLFGKKDADVAGYGVAQVDLPEGPRVQSILSGGRDDFAIGMEVETDLETLRQNKDGDDVVIYRFRPARDVPRPVRGPRREARPALRRRRRGRRRHGPLRHVQGHPGRAPGPRRRAARAARRRHDAGRRRRGLRGLHPAGADARHQGHEGARADRAAGHAHRERVGHRARGLPRCGLGRLLRPGRRGHGAVFRQVHRHDRHGRPRRRPGPDRRADPARRLLRAVGAAPHARPRHDARALRHHRGEELELRRGVPVRAPALRPHGDARGGARRQDGGRAPHHHDVLPARRRRRLHHLGPRGPRAQPASPAGPSSAPSPRPSRRRRTRPATPSSARSSARRR